jgi:hypothetical protein
MQCKYCLGAIALILVVAVGGIHLAQQDGRAAEPQDLCEAAAVLDRMGLYWSTGSGSNPDTVEDHSALTIAAEPITGQEAGSLVVGQAPERWRGKARVYVGTVGFGQIDGNVCCAAWGQLTLFGDPALVGRIVAHP